MLGGLAVLPVVPAPRAVLGRATETLTVSDNHRAFAHSSGAGKRDPPMKMLKKVQRFLKSEDGPTAVEYAVMLALIVIVCLTAIQAIGTNASATFQGVADAI